MKLVSGPACLTQSGVFFIVRRRLAPEASIVHRPAMVTLRLRVVLYREDGLWVAHALEMDLIGTGATETAALRELRSNVDAQLSFAKQEKANPFRPAPAEILKLWEDANLAAIGLATSRLKAPARSTRFLEWNETQVSRLGSTVFQCA